MSNASFQGALTSGHGSYPPTTIAEGAGTVFVEGASIARIGDKKTVHINAIGNSCSDPIEGGSGTVFAEGQGVSRLGDDTSQGGIIAEGAETVFVGE